MKRSPYHDCEKTAPPGFLLGGNRQPGERWTCECGRVWVHHCSEADGCCWVPANEARP